MIKSRKIFLLDEACLTSDNIIGILHDPDSKVVARSLLSKILYLRTSLEAYQIEKVLSCFDVFCDDSVLFNPGDKGSEINVLIGSFELELNSEFNEGGLCFDQTAHTFLPDIRSVSLEDCKKLGVISDIRKVFYQAAQTLRKRYNKHGKIWRRIFSVKDFPGVGNNLVVEKLSDGVFPTAAARADGTIAVNENFVKVMYLLAESGLREQSCNFENIFSDDYKFYREVDKKYTLSGNLYYSILYSIALHEMLGHFKVVDGSVVFAPGEDGATHAMRGERRKYINVIAISFFWLVVMDAGGGRIDEDSVRRFFNCNKQLVTAFSAEEVTAIINAVLKLSIVLNNSVLYQKVPKEEINEAVRRTADTEFLSYRDVTWQDIYDLFVYMLTRNDERIPVTDDVNSFFHEKYLRGRNRALKTDFSRFCISILNRMGLARTFSKKDDKQKKTIKTYYRVVPGFNRYDIPLLLKIRDVFKEQAVKPYESDIEGLNSVIAGILPRKGLSGTMGPRFISRDKILKADMANILRYIFSFKEPHLSIEEINEAFPGLLRMRLSGYLKILQDIGVITRKKNKYTYDNYDISEYNKAALIELLESREIISTSSDIEELGKKARLIIASSYKWADFMNMAKLFMEMRMVDEILEKEGLSPGKIHSKDEMRTFFRNLRKKYRKRKDEDINNVNLIYIFTRKYNINTTFMARLFKKKIELLEKEGQKNKLYRFEPAALLKELILVRDEISPEDIDIRRVMFLTDPVFMMTGLDVLNEIGIIGKDKNDDIYILPGHITSSLFDSMKHSLSAIFALPVIPDHFPGIRTFILNYSEPNWKMVSAVFSRIYESGDNGILQEDLEKNGCPFLSDYLRDLYVFDCVNILEELGLIYSEGGLNDSVCRAIDLTPADFLDVVRHISNLDKPLFSTNIADLKQEIFLKDIRPSICGAFYVFRKLKAIMSGELKVPGDLTRADVAGKVALYQKLPDINFFDLQIYLSFLERSGFIRATSVEGDNRENRDNYVISAGLENISFPEKLLKNDYRSIIDLSAGEIYSKVLKQTEPSRAWDLARRINSLNTDGSNYTGKPLLLVVDTDWIPEFQRPFMQEILRQLDEKEGIIVLRKSGGSILDGIDDVLSEKGLDWSDVLIFGGIEDINKASFWKIKDISDPGRNAFVAAVDNRDIDDRTYIGLIQMLTMAVNQKRFSTGETGYSTTYTGFKITENTRYGFSVYYQLPRPSKIDLEILKEIYLLQAHTLKNA
jgi:hypothetical protein